MLLEFDWSSTSLGPMATWPVERRSIVEMVMQTTFPICLAWGEDLIQIYNDGYNRIYGEKHPGAFGAPAAKSWPEIWEFLKPALHRVMTERNPQYFNNYLLPIRKSLVPEECYFTFCYSPIFAADASVAGVMSIAMETTAESIAERRDPLATFGADAPLDDVGSINQRLHHLLILNSLDAKAAFVYRPFEADKSLDWRIRCDNDVSRALRSLVEQRKGSNSSGLIYLDQGNYISGHASYLSFVEFKAADGKGSRVLVLWPSELVTESSILDLTLKLEKRLHLATQRLVAISQIKDELEQNDLLYRFVFNNTIDGIAYSSTNEDGTGPEIIMAVNDATRDMLGYVGDEMIGMRREDFFFADDDQLAHAVAKRAQQNVFRGELTFRHKSGKPIDLEIMSILAHLNSGQRRTITILRDLSEAIHRERERAERSRLEAIAQMTSGISHDFNNLLMVIMSAAEHLDASVTDAEQKDVVGDIIMASDRAAKLTSQLLAYSKRQDLRPSPIEINSSIKESERLIIGAVAKDMKLKFRYHRRRLIADVDLAHLTSALVNLAKNASEAVDRDGLIEISTTVRDFEEPSGDFHLACGKYVAISVADNGLGIPHRLLQRVFDPFFTTKLSQGGSGLGLSMVQGFARQSGGDLILTSVQNSGTTATIYLPLSDQTWSGSVAGNLTERARRSHVNVLIVDDDPLIRRQLARMLTSIGMKVTTVGTGADALTLLARQPELVITDLAMPGEYTGADIVEACKRSKPVIPVIVMSGFASDPRWTASVEQASALMTKPFTRKVLVSAIAKALR